MRKVLLIWIATLISFVFASEIPASMKPWKTNIEKLSEFEKHVVIEKGTERAFSGEYVYTKEDGIYRCKVCDAPLFRSSDKFESHCGWPSFDDAIPGAIKEVPDSDGKRTEIVCANCGAHLGHVFRGKGIPIKIPATVSTRSRLTLRKSKAVIRSRQRPISQVGASGALNTIWNRSKGWMKCAQGLWAAVSKIPDITT